MAPEFTLPSTINSTFQLDNNQSTLLYFQEGIQCQACWVQLVDIESQWNKFEHLGIDEIVTITTDPIETLKELADIIGFETPLLSDRDLSVSKRYNTNEYAMPGMGDGHNGHSFILVDEYGEIQWRADYGRYTMYVPVEILIEQIEQSIEQKNLSSADYA